MAYLGMGASALFAVCALLTVPPHGVACDSTASYQTVKGSLMFPPEQSPPPAASTQIVLKLESGKQLRAYLRADQTFEVQRVPVGAHRLEAFTLGYHIPAVRLDVGADGDVKAAYSDTESKAPYPLQLLAIPVDYFDKVVPFNLVAFLKSPMGMMVGFMIFALVVVPKLKVDPEEMKELLADREANKQQQQQRGQQQPEQQGRVTAAQVQRALDGPQQRGGRGSRR